MNDSDFIMVTYMSNNKGQHPVYGTRTRQFYGYRKGGEEFLVHRDDASAQPHLFREVKRESVKVAQREPEPVGAPKTISDAPDEDLVPVEDVPEEEPEQEETDIEEINKRLKSMTPLNLGDLDLRKEAVQSLAKNRIVTEERILELGVEGLQEVKWIGEATAIKLVNLVRGRRGMELIVD